MYDVKRELVFWANQRQVDTTKKREAIMESTLSVIRYFLDEGYKIGIPVDDLNYGTEGKYLLDAIRNLTETRKEYRINLAKHSIGNKIDGDSYSIVRGYLDDGKDEDVDMGMKKSRRKKSKGKKGKKSR